MSRHPHHHHPQTSTLHGTLVCRYCRYKFDLVLTLEHPIPHPPPPQDCENCGRLGATWLPDYDTTPDDLDLETSDADPTEPMDGAPDDDDQ